MASIAFWLADNGLSDAVPHDLYGWLFYLAVPIVFAPMAVWLGWRTLITIVHFAWWDEPVLRLTDDGVSVRHLLTAPLAWADVANVEVFRTEKSVVLVIHLTSKSRYHRRFWPFWTAATITLHVADPLAAVAAIRSHFGYRGMPASPIEEA